MSETPQGQIVTMPGRRGLHVLDARGVPVRIINLENPKQMFPWWAEVPARDQRRIVNHVPGLSFRRWGKIAFLVVGTLMPVWAAATVWHNTMSPLSRTKFFPFGPLLMVIPALLAQMPLWVAKPASIRQAVDGFLAHRMCPACAHALESLPVAADGCTVCPECGSAWRVEPPSSLPRT